jgi:hypothetical protein
LSGAATVVLFEECLRVLTKNSLTLVLVGAIVSGLAVTVVGAVRAGDLELVGANRASTLELSLEMLSALPQVTVITENEFSNGEVAYRGPLVRDVLGQLGLGDAESVRLVAANDYFVDIPTQDFRDYDAILAMEADGKQLSRRDKGPLWLMYPISDHDELRDPLYLRRLIWQVVRIEAL